jgi:dolichol-phosphate mannosyltransferase
MVVPTYNEGARLAELVADLFVAADRDHLALAVVIVDDNSPDGTGGLADRLADQYPLTVLHRPGKLGLGSAVIDGIAAASTGIIGVMDADFSHSPALVPLMYRTFVRTGADMLVASRYVPGGSTPNWPSSRRGLSRLACLLAQPLTPIRDATSGFFLLRRSVAEGVVIKARGFKIGLELLVRAAPARLVEVPFRFEDRAAGESKMTLREAAGYLVQLKDLYRVRWAKPLPPGRTYRRLTAAEVGGADASSRSGPA